MDETLHDIARRLMRWLDEQGIEPENIGVQIVASADDRHTIMSTIKRECDWFTTKRAKGVGSNQVALHGILFTLTRA